MQNQFSLARLALLGALFVVVAIFVVNLTINVPVEVSTLPRSEATQYWPVALIAAIIVVTVDGFTISLILRRRASEKAGTGARVKGAEL